MALLQRSGVTVRFGCRLSQVERDADRVRTLNFSGEAVPLDAGDRVVLALPPAATGSLLPALDVPKTSHVIVNAHFVLDEPAALPAGSPFLGLIGGTAQWLFVRGSVASITISAGDAVAEGSADEIARATWRDVAAALDRDPRTVPTCRVIKERRATFAQTPAEVRRRPATRTGMGQPVPGRRLDRHRPAGNHRGCHPVRLRGGQRGNALTPNCSPHLTGSPLPG